MFRFRMESTGLSLYARHFSPLSITKSYTAKSDESFHPSAIMPFEVAPDARESPSEKHPEGGFKGEVQ